MLLTGSFLNAQNALPRPLRPNAPGPGDINVSAVVQEREGPQYKLRGHVKLETTEMLLEADEIDYNEETGAAEARGNVKFQHFAGGEQIEAAKVEYNLQEETGKYFEIKGSSPAKIEARPGVLTTSNPFSFQGEWAERLKDRYVLHNGFITNCKLPKPWWILRGPVFDIVPGDRAIARSSTFVLRRVPLFYTPFFYKSLAKMPRRSGLLTPNIGNSSRRGKMIGVGYYWAINRSYDLTYRTQLFTQRGLAHHVDFRGKPNDRSDFNFILYGVNDRGLLLDDRSRRKEGGYLLTLDGKSDLGHGFLARGAFTYLSSFAFRQAFTESFFEAIFSEVHSIGYITKHWSTFGFNFVTSENENFQSRAPDDKIAVRKLPSLELTSRDRQIAAGALPIWLSFNASAGLLRRNQLSFQTRRHVDRLDVEPRITTAIRWKDLNLIPSFSIRETSYGSSFDANGRLTGNQLLRSSREFSLDLRLPSLARVYDAPGWLGPKLKHVIEPRARFRSVDGIEDFQRIIRFDENDIVSNTREAEVSLTNRLFAKRKDGQVQEVMSWEVFQQRFFDPTFGGAVVAGQRNVFTTTEMFSGYTFLAEPRNYSPVGSTLRVNPDPRLGIEWRTDYDPLRGHIVNSGISADARISKYLISMGHNQVR
ncbi:MAG TPA: LPS assembly protein LptD, partial [Bryobacteraceae bacterium]|nr:LPS assembly protein LptD [Bryobacteraceae bacterium]